MKTILSLAALCAAVLCGCSKQVVPSYTIQEIKDSSASGRSRWSAYVVAPDANTRDEFVSVTRAVATNLQREKAADVIQVFLEYDPERIGEGLSLATATYIPDGKGYSGMDPSPVWKIDAEESREGSMAAEFLKLARGQ